MLAPVLEYIMNLSQLDAVVSAGVAAEGPGATYALVWEFGNMRQTKPGPKTVMGYNPVSGEVAYFSTQAPMGYVRVLTPVFHAVIVAEMAKVKFESGDKDFIRLQLAGAASRITQQMAQLIQQTAPVDTGVLRMGIVAVPPGDELLATVQGYTLEMETA